jgi:DNA invertase Pin-like site-specific DNA recombinase
VLAKLLREIAAGDVLVVVRLDRLPICQPSVRRPFLI